MRCDQCRFYDDGTCRRYAPRPSMDANNLDSPIWPEVLRSEWCGEFERKEDRPWETTTEQPG